MKASILSYILLFALLCGAMPQTALAQTKSKTTIEIKSERLPQVFKRIEKKTDTKIVFAYDDVNLYSYSGRLDIKNADEAVRNVINGKPLKMRREGKYIYIDADKTAPATTAQGTIIITGKVVDSQHEPLPGVTVLFVGQNRGFATDAEGRFQYKGPKNQAVTMRFSFIGMNDRIITYDGKDSKTGIIVVMEYANDQLSEVVVNGIFERKASSFTGSAITFDKEQLMEVNNHNLFSSLSALDPAFQVVENTSMGSNPNSMPTIQLRGQTSFNIQGDYDGNANQPLFIVDGFESSLESVYDLDMERIESVTILKDAAAKAVYGSKAGNGVVVIQTRRPKSGEMRISYSGNLSVEAPDLSGYNLMNAQEKYDWEVSHNKYTGWQASNSPYYADLLEKSVQDAIYSGIDTDWLAQPLRNGVGQKHSLNLEGGDDKIRYILGASYNDIAGVMKASNRRTMNIFSTLSYTYKNMVFRNQINYTENKAKNSPYGTFADYVGLEPYFAPYDANGNTKQILGYETVSGDGFYNPVYNPLYNSTLNNKDESHYTTFNDNFDMDWHINQQWRLTAKMSYTKTNNGSDLFYAPNHTKFAEYDENGYSDRKGQYTKTNGMTSSLTLQAGANYNLMLDKHALFANLTWNMQTQNNRLTTVVAEGFGNDNMDDISMANYYEHNGAPTGADSKTREIGVIGALNYSYDNRYLLDGSYRLTGSSVYGSDNHWGGFWSAGAGWNIHNETFMKNMRDEITLLKLRYSVGYTGTQNFNPYQARAKYKYGTSSYDGRYGATLMGLFNNGLKWQKIMDHNIGLDFAWRNMITLRAEYYVQNTDNMLTDITLPASTGFQTYKENMGEMQNKGMEFTLGITPWRDTKNRGWVTLSATALHNKNKITKIYDIFRKSNDEADSKLNQDGYSNYNNDGTINTTTTDEYIAQTTRPATKYYEGCSMTSIWGVRSLGIDPVSGNEMYLDKNGNVTYTWNSDDQVVIGDTNPALRGAITLSGGYKGWSLSIVASYKLGGDVYNTSLIDRVENVTGYGNLDKRVSETWNTPGQIAEYRKIEMTQSPSALGVTTRPTSRFVQRDNELYVSSVNIGYDFFQHKWIKNIGLERLKLNFYCNELFRFNSVRVERGLSYPFARTFTFSLNATF